MNCERDIAEQVVVQNGEYVLAPKGNQGTLHADVALFLDDPNLIPDSTNSEVDGGHGRIETRTSVVSTDIDWLQEQHQWPALAAIAKLTRTRESGATLTTETAYYLLSTALGADRLGAVVRSHWGIENSLHWVLDVTMNEDQTRNRKDNGP
jgi:predicted transposase YbfD/YdcC